MVDSDLLLWLSAVPRRPLVVGVINMTPDSFSDGGRLSGPDQAADLAEQMANTGADWLDIGGESTRPGALPVPAEEQIRRTFQPSRPFAAGWTSRFPSTQPAPGC